MPQSHTWIPSVRSEQINQLELKLLYLGHLARLSVLVGFTVSEVQTGDCELAVQETLLIARDPSLSVLSCSVIGVHCNILIQQQTTLLKTFYDSAVASAIVFGVVCWGSSISSRDRKKQADQEGQLCHGVPP